MLGTIALSPYIQIQGMITRRLPCGSVAIRHGGREYVGRPINQAAPGTRHMRAVDMS